MTALTRLAVPGEDPQLAAKIGATVLTNFLTDFEQAFPNHASRFIGYHFRPTLCITEFVVNKVRVLQRRAYGPRDEEYLRLKILTCMLPAI